MTKHMQIFPGSKEPAYTHTWACVFWFSKKSFFLNYAALSRSLTVPKRDKLIKYLQSNFISSIRNPHIRTSYGGNRNHSVSLPIILIKIKVKQMLPSSYISSQLVSILWFCIWFPISMNVRLYFGAKMVTFCIIHIGNQNLFLKHHSPRPLPPPRVPTNPFARKCVLIFYITYVKS